MWQCPECGFMNEDLDALCLRCESPRESAAPEQAAESPPQSAAVPQDFAAPPAESVLPRQARGLEGLAVAIIVISVLGLIGVGYLAWSRGMLGGAAAKPDPATKVTVIEGTDTLDLDVEDALTTIERSKDRRLEPYATHVAVLREVDTAVNDFAIELQGEGVLAEKTKQQLHGLADIGRRLADSYALFEEQALEKELAGLEETGLLRRAFIERMTRMIDSVGEAYLVDGDLNHPAYILSDTLPAAIDQAGVGDGQPLRDRWLDVVHRRDQRLLDAGLTTEYTQLQAYIETLNEIHADYAEVLDSIPPYKIRGGFIGKDAERALTAYEDLATKVEEITLQFQGYIAQFPEVDRPDTMKKLIEQFETLAKEDHAFSFMEAYRIYAQDRELRHPAYDRLADHYKFVEANWPELALNYKAIYLEYEAKWAGQWDRD